MDGLRGTFGDSTYSFLEQVDSAAVYNTVFKYVSFESALRGLAGWAMYRNARTPEVTAPDFPANSLDAEALAEGLVLGYAAPGS